MLEWGAHTGHAQDYVGGNSDISYANKDVEVWISVIEQGQEGMIRTEFASRWLISMKD